MGDRGHNRHGPKIRGLLCLFRGGGGDPGELDPRLTQRGLDQVYFRTKWRFHPSSRLATIDMGRKLGDCAPFRGSWVPIEHKVAWAEAYLYTKWHLSPFSRLATTDIGRKLGGLCRFRGAGSPSNAMSPRLRPTSLPSGILIYAAVWPQ